METISAYQFFQAWLDTVQNRKCDLLKLWRQPKDYTYYIKGSDNSVMEEVAQRLNLQCYPLDYYSIDTILYKPEDKTPGIKHNTNWFRDIRVAFEHENYFHSGLYQEVSHLLITHCDLKVLVSYPDDEQDAIAQLQYLHHIISGTRQSKVISDNESFLIIWGYESDFEWEGYIYHQDDWKRIVCVQHKEDKKYINY
ncbi:hypothetical protein [Pontibacter chinhatensis]|uniref:Uncharacterized protein n=1 Tax=Pontibacter chinhatensis TaxID=1436961 RepID=A0A1I2ZMH0_9BACT|nr:hypothetical protein [Pontibacter chinhatensis]SFH38855.1 hypothetical protein SAMN05421739_1162 [Pontibacter chinhatensis]